MKIKQGFVILGILFLLSSNFAFGGENSKPTTLHTDKKPVVFQPINTKEKALKALSEGNQLVTKGRFDEAIQIYKEIEKAPNAVLSILIEEEGPMEDSQTIRQMVKSSLDRAHCLQEKQKNQAQAPKTVEELRNQVMQAIKNGDTKKLVSLSSCTLLLGEIGNSDVIFSSSPAEAMPKLIDSLKKAQWKNDLVKGEEDRYSLFSAQKEDELVFGKENGSWMLLMYNTKGFSE